MAFTFADLMTVEGQSVIAARLLANLKAAGQPTDSWAPSSVGGVENIRLDMVAGGIQQLMATRVANLVNGRLLGLATDTPENGYWLTYLGRKFYKLEKRQATFAIQNIALYTPAGSAPVSATFEPGDLVVKSVATGNMYRNIDGGAFTSRNVWQNAPLILDPSLDNPLMLRFVAESPGSSFSDGDTTITAMVTAPAGIRCANVRPADFTPMRHSGFSTGSMTGAWSNPAIAPAASSFRARIDATGDVGAALFSYSLDGGATWRGGGALPATFGVAGMTIAFANGAGSPGSFVAGDVLTILVQSAIVQRGADAETDAAFRARCASRWPAISLIPVKGTIELWAKQASDEVNKVLSDADPNTPGGILVTIASATGPASPQAVVAVEDYITERLQGFKDVAAPASPAVAGSTSPQETASVKSADSFPITVTGVAYVPKAKFESARASADPAWNSYLASLPIGGQAGAVVDNAELVDILADLGAIDVRVFMNGSPSDQVISPGSVAIPASGTTLVGGIFWVAV